jgi:hypothetical protein
MYRKFLRKDYRTGKYKIHEFTALVQTLRHHVGVRIAL